LEALPGWAWNRVEDRWEDGFARLQSYVKREAHSRVSQHYHDGDGYRLGQWVGLQRSGFQKGTLEEDRRTRLAALPGWTWDPIEDAWQDLDHDGFRLGLWVANRRQDYRRGTLDEQRRRRLEALPGWAWSSP
jgi:hypothetical protein